MVNVDRVSFALAREWIPRNYKNLNELIEDKGKEYFEEVTNYIFHYAVQNVAMIWYKDWLDIK